MPLITKDQPQIKADILRDIANLLPEAQVGDDSDFSVRASATSAAIEGIMQHLHWIVKQIFPDTSDADIMEIHAGLRDITRKAATIATGSIQFSGTANSVIPVGTEVATASNVRFVTTAHGVIGNTGNANVAAQAVLAGFSGNIASQTTLTLSNAPSGLQNTAVANDFLSGTDVESDESLLNRLLFLLRNPPSSGNNADYKRWALEVPGVSSAAVYSLRRGLGTTDIIITSAGGLPSAVVIQNTQAHIDLNRPVGLNTVNVLAPAIVQQNWDIRLEIAGTTLADVTGLVHEVLDSYYNNIAPGETVVKSAVEALISNIEGVNDRLIVSPAFNVAPTVDATTVQWCRKGTVNVSLMT